MAVRTGRTGMFGYCSGKVVVRSETEDPALRVDERNRDLTPIDQQYLVSGLPTTHELAWFAVSAVGEREFQPYNETLLSVCISADGRNP